MKQVLITNNGLHRYSGTECYVLEVARGLQQRGWQPLAFSTELGDVAQAMRQLSIPVVSDLKKLPRAPDLIHAHHHLEAIIAIQSFPGVPVIYFCHGWAPWQERPLVHPQIVHYVAVDALCYERLVFETGIPESMVSLQLNFVDLQRFQRRAPLPEKPLKALLYGNGLSPRHPTSLAIEAACQNLGIELDQVGRGFSKSMASPESQLGQYDVVFAKARCAMEAIASGCAVVTCDVVGLAGMVTPENFSEFRCLNFGYRLLQRNPIPTVQEVEQALLLYHADQASQVTDRMREEGGYEQAMDRLEALYHTILIKHTPLAVDAVANSEALSAYLYDLAHQTKLLHPLPSKLRRQEVELRNWQMKSDRLEAKVTKVTALHAKTHQELELHHQAKTTKIQKETTQARLELSQSRKAHHELHSAYQQLEAYTHKLQAERKVLLEEKSQLKLKIRQQTTQLERLRLELKRFRGLKRFLPKWML